MDIEKLRAILEQLGVEPEKIEAAVAAMSEEEVAVEPEPVVEGNGEEPSTSEEEPVEEGEPASEGGEPNEVEGEEEVVVAPEEEVPADPESVPPTEEVAPELPPEVVEGGVPVPEEPPVVSLEEFNQVKADLEEVKKALEGAKGSIESLVQSLKESGIISGEVSTPVGQDEPSVPGVQSNDTMEQILREINSKGY